MKILNCFAGLGGNRRLWIYQEYFPADKVIIADAHEYLLQHYKEAPELKKRQADEVLGFIKWGANNMLQLSELTGIPQAIVSARVNDLINEKKIVYSEFTYYRERKRKKIIIVKQVKPGVQANLFQ